MYGGKELQQAARLQAAAHQLQQNSVPEPPGPSVSSVAAGFESIHGRLVALSERFHQIAYKLAGPMSQPAVCGTQKEPEPVGVLARLYAVKDMIDLQLDNLNDAMCHLDKAV